MTRPTQRFRVGLRREMLILLPVAGLMMVLLSTFTLLSYRGSVRLLAEERRAEAVLLARDVAESIVGGTLPVAPQLRRRAPHAARVAVLGPALQVLVETGAAASGESMELDTSSLAEPVALDRAVSPAGRIVALAPFLRQGQRLLVRLELDATQLDREQARLSVLTWVVLVANTGLALLLVFFLRHLLAPWDQLLAHAQKVRPRDEESEDEAAFLVSSFETALEALSVRSDSEEIAALEGMLGPSLESGLLLIGRRREVLALNPAGAELLGLDVPEAPGTSLDQLLEPHPQLLELVSRAVEDGEALQRQEIDIRSAGEPRPLGLTLHPLKREGAPPRGYLLLFADLTETRQKAREERLSVSLNQVGELAAGVAHEMRNGLATIRGYLTLAERRPEGDSLDEYLGDLRHESDHLQRVLEDFLTFARPGSTHMEELDLGTLARRAAADPTLADLEVRVSSEPDVAATIQGDPQLLERAIRNLLHNAAEAERGAGSTGPLEVRLERAGEQVALSILDRGTGIPEDIRERLFEPFVTGTPHGVGLGLSLALRIVTLHGGRLRLEDREGGGTRAVVELPAAASGAG